MMLFNKRLNSNPRCWSLRLIYADWLEDQGDSDGAATQRWMAKHKIAPKTYYSIFWEIKQLLDDKNCWNWWISDGDPTVDNNVLCKGSVLPREVYLRLKGEYNNDDFCEYVTRQEAEYDLQQALKSLGLI